MPRFEIVRGELLSSYEPHDLDGAFITTRHKVTDPTGAVPSEKITWSGRGEWIESRDGVPDGFNALVLGARDASRICLTGGVTDAHTAPERIRADLERRSSEAPPDMAHDPHAPRMAKDDP